jgi:hypothetical protein
VPSIENLSGRRTWEINPRSHLILGTSAAIRKPQSAQKPSAFVDLNRCVIAALIEAIILTSI